MAQKALQQTVRQSSEQQNVFKCRKQNGTFISLTQSNTKKIG